MSTIPSAANRVFWGAQTVLTVSGATHQAVGTVRFKWGYDIKREVVTGNSLAYYGTGAFKGTIEFEGLGSSDNRWENAVTITSGIVPTFGMTWKEQDTQSTISGRTWTVSGKFMEYEKLSEGDRVVKYRLKGEIVTEPTVV